MEEIIGIILLFSVIVGSVAGVSSCATSTNDKVVISHCKEKGVYYYGQTKMACKIEE